MIMGHIGFGSVFDKWIHGFHMPMFFFISGWFFHKTNIPYKTLIEKRLRTLIVPYLAFGTIELAVCYLTGYYDGLEYLKSFLFTNTDGQSPVPGALWFLTAMFFSELIYIELDKMLSINTLHIWVIAFSIFGMISTKVLPFRLPWGIDAGCVGIGLIHIGRMWKNSRTGKKLFSLKIWQALIIGIVATFLILICPYVNMRTASYSGYPMFWINTLLAIIADWNLCRFTYDFLHRNKFGVKISQWLQRVGKNSIVYLCLNQICIIVSGKIMKNIGIPKIIERFGTLVLVLGVLLVIEYIICNTKLKIVIGRR